MQFMQVFISRRNIEEFIFLFLEEKTEVPYIFEDNWTGCYFLDDEVKRTNYRKKIEKQRSMSSNSC
jgi:hypothetical protein